MLIETEDNMDAGTDVCWGAEKEEHKNTMGTMGGSRHGHWQQFYILTVCKVIIFSFVLARHNLAIFTKQNVF